MSMTVFELMATLALDTSKFNNELDSSEQKASTFGSKISNATKVGAAAFAAVSSAAVATGAGLTKAVGGVAEYGDNIDKMAQKMGMSSDAYQEWDAIMQHSGTSIETMKASMKTLANAAETGKDAFDKLGISQEEVANLSQEDLFARTIQELQNVSNDTERTYLAGQLLGKGATELGALLNTSAEDTEKMRQRVHELGGVMSEDAVKASAAFQDSLQDMQTAFSGIKRMALTDFMPGITTVMNGITSIFAGEDGGGAMVAEGIDNILDTIGTTIPKFVSRVGEIAKAVGSAISDHMPSIIEAIPGVIEKITGFISSNLPTIAATGVQIIVALAKGLIQAIPEIVKSVPQVIAAIAEALKNVDWLSVGASMIQGFFAIAEAGLEAVLSIDWLELGKTILGFIVQGIGALVTAIPDALFSIGQTAFEKFQNIDWEGLGSTVINFVESGIDKVKTIPDKVKQIGDSAVELFQRVDWVGAGTAAVNFTKRGFEILFNEIPNKLKEIGVSAWNSFINIDWLELGKNIILGIAQGIWNNVSTVINAITGVVSNAIDAAKDFLGISSPSKKFRDVIGKPMAQGIGVGFEDAMPVQSMKDALQNAMDMVADVDMGQFEDDFADLMEKPGYEDGGSDELSVATVDLDNDGRANRYPADNITFNVYAKEHQDEKQVAEEVMKLFTLWDDQKKRAFA